MQILDGKALADKMVLKIKQDVQSIKAPKPKLAIVQVGNDPASNSYITQKKLMSSKAGFDFSHIQLASTTTPDELVSQIKLLNEDSSVSGFLVQLPLPKHLSPDLVVDNISPEKDVDGFHPNHLGNTFYGNCLLPPCTPLGIKLLLESENIDARGLHTVIVGASNIVGKPLAILLSNMGATVTICHKYTRNLNSVIAMADILVSATGNKKAIDSKYIPKGCIVIDVGIHTDANGKITGDLDATIVKELASYYTPVPGGVGPMTVAALLHNTWIAHLAKLNAK